MGMGISICFVCGDQAIRSRIDITEPDLNSPFFDTCSLGKISGILLGSDYYACLILFYTRLVKGKRT